MASIVLKHFSFLKNQGLAQHSVHHDFLMFAMAVQHDEEGELALDHEIAPPPPLYKVLLLNDDYTPMDFVIKVLEGLFHLGREQATRVMLEVHNRGVGVAGIYPRDIAETKVHRVTEYARNHQHPLQCIMEKD